MYPSEELGCSSRTKCTEAQRGNEKKKSSVGSSKKNKNKLFIKCYVHEEQVRGHLGLLISFFLNKTQHILVFFFVSFKFSLRSLDTSYIVC